MKKFIDKEGDYIIYLPVEWGYQNSFYEAKESNPDSFELYENSVGCFQISCKSKKIGKIPDLINTHELQTQAFGASNLNFKEIYTTSSKFDMYLWIAVVGNKFVMCKYITDSESKKNEKVLEELNKARQSLKTFFMIEEKDKNQVLASERFNKFMTSLAASIDLKNRAYANSSSIELVILLANQIDALLRLALILDKQLKNKTDEIDIAMIFQNENDKPIMEKKVYDIAVSENIITEDFSKELYRLYDIRNKVVHRYIISDLLTRDVMKLVIDYGIAEEELGNIVKKYEQLQFKSNIGIYGTSNPPDEPLDELKKAIVVGGLKEKHAHKGFNKGITFTI